MWAISKGNVIFQPSFFRGYLSYWSGGVCTFSFPEKKGGAVFWFSWNILPVFKMGWNIGREALKLRFHLRNVHWLISRPHQEWKELMWVVWVVTEIGMWVNLIPKFWQSLHFTTNFMSDFGIPTWFLWEKCSPKMATHNITVAFCHRALWTSAASLQRTSKRSPRRGMVPWRCGSSRKASKAASWNCERNLGTAPNKTRWWFQMFFIFIPIWGRFPSWLIFFRWVETTN